MKVNLESGEIEEIDAIADAAWIAQREVDALTPSASQADYAAAIQIVLDAKAAERGYDGILSAVSYIADPDTPGYSPIFDAEARALKAYRTAAWTFSNEQLTLVARGERTQPTVEVFLAELTAAVPFAWPEV